MSLANEDLQKLIDFLNSTHQYKYSGEVSTNSKGEAQIDCKVRGDDKEVLKSELDQFIQEVISILRKNGLKLPQK